MTEDDSHPSRDSRAPLLRRGLLALLLVILVGAVAFAGYLTTDRSVPALGIEGTQESLQNQRDLAGAAAEQFMLRVNSYDPSMLAEDGTMPTYRDQVEAVITPKFAADFEQAVPLTEQVVKQSSITLTCQVFSTGISSIDSDSATALVAGATTATIPAKDGGDPQVINQPSQMQLSLVKVKGHWLVDDFSPLVGNTQPSGSPSPSDGAAPSPTDAPTSAPTSGGATP